MTEQVYPPWEPPFAGTEVEHVLGSLERMQATFRWKADGLSAAQLGTPLPTSALTVGGLLKHLALQEDYCSAVKIAGGSMPGLWHDLGWDQDDDEWEFTTGAQDPPEVLYPLYDGAVVRARDIVTAAIEERGITGDSGVRLPDGSQASIRRVLFDRIEEYCRHTGHLDLVREALDGRTGEDPPSDWRP
ncbi:MAG TPA: DUF664 domain-containing protein [Nocardioides sp.]|nr:DUF664 domain-containing protein [Nocardioides sp.]